MSILEERSSISWRVLSYRNDGGREDIYAGYWTASYSDADHARAHAVKVQGHAFEVTTRFMYEDETILEFIGETWERLM